MLIDTIAKSNRSSRIALSVVITVIITVAAYNWMLAPHTKYLQAAQQYELVADDIAKKNALIKSRQAVKEKEIERLQTQIAELQAAVFTPVEAKRFFSDLEAICAETDCMVRSMNFLSGRSDQSSVSDENQNAVIQNSAALNFVGSYSNIIELLTKIVNRPQNITIRSLKVSALGSNPDVLECEALITIYVVYDMEILTNE